MLTVLTSNSTSYQQQSLHIILSLTHYVFAIHFQLTFKPAADLTHSPEA